MGSLSRAIVRWKKIYGSMEPSEARAFKQLRDENTKLKRGSTSGRDLTATRRIEM